MSGLDTFLWRASVDWPTLVALGEGVVARWNSVTRFETRTDAREHQWTVRHSSNALPFLMFSADNLRGSVPRIGNPMPFLLLLGICHDRADALELSFINGQKIDPQRFELSDLTGLLPHATHPAHRKLAALAMKLDTSAP
ncbi:MAG: hypothetical protein REI09_02685 [Candidatus Dactylopiibacterium sp.]|nr:hypothetical protein [Candidatus Dactylopiibacterium sp.]